MSEPEGLGSQKAVRKPFEKVGVVGSRMLSSSLPERYQIADDRFKLIPAKSRDRFHPLERAKTWGATWSACGELLPGRV